MPRRKPDSVNELRYEFSLGPKEQPLVEELTQTVQNINTLSTVAAISTPIAIGAIGYGLYEGLKYVGVGIANIGAGLTPENMLKQTANYTGPGLILNWLVPESKRYNEDGTQKSTVSAVFDELAKKLGKSVWW